MQLWANGAAASVPGQVLPALYLASCAEKGSEHPLGQAVARDAEKMLQQWSTATEAGKMGMEKWGSRKAGVKTSRNGV